MIQSYWTFPPRVMTHKAVMCWEVKGLVSEARSEQGWRGFIAKGSIVRVQNFDWGVQESVPLINVAI